MSGHLTDIYGRRNGLLVSYAFFFAGTLICGLAPKISVFLLGRFLQGLGGGGITSIAAFLETDLVPTERRAFIEGLGNVAFGVTAALAGIYGGSINDTIGWRWAFLIQVPGIALVAGVTVFTIKEPIRKINVSGWRQIDFVGGISLLAATVLLQLGLANSMPTAVVGASLSAAGILFAIFVYWDLRVACHPVNPIAALADRTLALSQLSAFFASAAYSGIVYYVPIYLQVTGNSSFQAGLRFIPLALAFAIGCFFCGLIVTATGRYYYVNLAIQAVEVLTGSLVCTLTVNTPSFAPFIYLGLLGLGEGGICVIILMALLSASDSTNQTAVQAAVWSIKSIGNSVGVTAASKLFQQVFSKAVVDNLGPKSNKDVAMSLIQNITSTLELPNDLSNQSIKAGVLDAHMTGLHAVALLSFGAVTLAAVLSLGIKNNLLSSKEGDLPKRGRDELADAKSNMKSEIVEKASLSDNGGASINLKPDCETKRRGFWRLLRLTFD